MLAFMNLATDLPNMVTFQEIRLLALQVNNTYEIKNKREIQLGS